MSGITVNLSDVRWATLDEDNPLHHSLFAMRDLVQEARRAIGKGEFYHRMRKITELRCTWSQERIQILSDAVFHSLRIAHHEAVKQQVTKLVGIMATFMDNDRYDVAFEKYATHPLLADLMVIFYNDPDLRDMLEEIKVRALQMKRKSVA